MSVRDTGCEFYDGYWKDGAFHGEGVYTWKRPTMTYTIQGPFEKGNSSNLNCKLINHETGYTYEGAFEKLRFINGSITFRNEGDTITCRYKNESRVQEENDELWVKSKRLFSKNWELVLEEFSEW